MVPNKFSMVDLEGIDIVESQGIEIPGLYQKLTNAIAQCRYQVIYNWKFDNIVIPPSYVEMEIDGSEVKINDNISVSDADVVYIHSLEIHILPVINELSVTENGEYRVPEGVDGYNPVTVDVQPPLEEITITENGEYLPSTGYYGIGKVNASIISGVPLLTRAEWNSLTTQEKQSYDLVAIQDAVTGFWRGVLVYGADYASIGFYLPYSNSDKIICEAYVDNFDSQSEYWGLGDSPVELTGNYSLIDGAVSIPVQSLGSFAYVDLGSSGKTFTAYVVMKAVNPGSECRLIASFNSRSSEQGIMLFNNPIKVTSWGVSSDYNLNVSATDYFVGVIQFAGNGVGKGTVYGKNIITRNSSTAGRYVVLGRTDLEPSTYNAAPCDVMVKYLAVVDDVDSENVITQNLQHLYNTFIQGG